MGWNKIGSIRALEGLANRIKKEKDIADTAHGVLSLAKELMYLNGCVKRGRGEDIDSEQPGNNVFEYIKELEVVNEHLTQLCKELLVGADKASQAPHFIVQPFLGIMKRHAGLINLINEEEK